MNGPALLAVQLLDSEVDQIAGRRKRLPQRALVAELQAQHAAISLEQARLQAIVDAAYAAVEQAEVAGADLDRKKARLEAQLRTVIAPREAEALMHEIATIQAQHGELDDRELEAMDHQAQAEGALAELAAGEPRLLAALAEAQDELDVALAGLAVEESEVRERRQHADAVLDDGDRATYAAMVKRYGGVGFSRLERRTCTGCHVDLSQVEYERAVRAPAGELPDCPHCGRYLVV